MGDAMKKKILKMSLYSVIIFLIYQVCFNIILDFKLVKNNEEFIKYLLADANYYNLYEKKNENFVNKAIKKIFNDDPIELLEDSFHTQIDSTPKMKLMSNKIELKTTVYIYNTHQKEAYAGKGLKEYNITPGVLMASYLFQAKLKDQNVNAQILENDLIEYMNLNNMNHAQSYNASRIFVENALKENKDLKLVIDLHRDSLPKERSSVMINNKPCAKILFVVGKEHKNANRNLETADKLNNMIKDKYPSLTRGVLEKQGPKVNGIYNQDLSDKIILLELGGQENTVLEVLNTISLLSPIIGGYVNEK